MQFIAWIEVLASLVLFFGLCVPFAPDASTRGAYLGVYFAIFIVGLTLFFWVELSDPIHPHVATPDKAVKPQGEDSRLCEECHVFITMTTKHCRICKKCVIGFDHHCLYLNTCIGSRNYRPFFALIACCTLLNAWHVAVLCWLAADSGSASAAQVLAQYGLTRDGLVSLLAVTGVVPALGLVLIASLLAFHLYITIVGTSTYKWMLDRRRRQEMVQEKKREISSPAVATSIELEARAKLDERREAERKQWLKDREAEKLAREKKKRQSELGLGVAASASPGASAARLSVTHPGVIVSNPEKLAQMRAPSPSVSSSSASSSSVSLSAVTVTEREKVPVSLNESRSETPTGGAGPLRLALRPAEHDDQDAQLSASTPAWAYSPRTVSTRSHGDNATDQADHSMGISSGAGSSSSSASEPAAAALYPASAGPEVTVARDTDAGAADPSSSAVHGSSSAPSSSLGSLASSAAHSVSSALSSLSLSLSPVTAVVSAVSGMHLEPMSPAPGPSHDDDHDQQLLADSQAATSDQFSSDEV